MLLSLAGSGKMLKGKSNLPTSMIFYGFVTFVFPKSGLSLVCRAFPVKAKSGITGIQASSSMLH
jgi:hypothetical protein